MVVRRKATNEKIFAVGGQWDRARQEWTTQPAKRCKVLYLNEAQCLGLEGNALDDGPAAAIRNWIDARHAGGKRVIELVLDGGRGSGKSVLGVLAVFLIAVEFPDSRCWLISPANTRRGELARIVRDFIPSSWRVFNKQDLTYTLPNGSTVTFIGADDEDALKQGGYEVALLNEAQLITSQAYANAVAGVRNVSGRPKGLLLLAHNYAAKERGEWTNDHLDQIEAGKLNARHHKLDPKLNGFIDDTVVDDIDGAIRSVRPDLADIDSLGIRKRLGDFAAAAFKPHGGEGGHVATPPTMVVGLDGKPQAGWFDITREITAKKTGSDRGFARVVGADFQRHPGCVAVVFRIFRNVATSEVIYFAEKCIVAGDNEDDLAQKIDSYLADLGLTARDALVVADSTGAHQNAGHTTRTKPSHAILQEYHFTVVGPRKILKSGKVGKANPDVEDSLAQFYDICKAGRFIVDPSAEWQIESLRRCKIKKRGGTIRLDDSKPGYSHAVDCDRYVTWYFEPRRGVVPEHVDDGTADEIRKIRFLQNY